MNLRFVNPHLLALLILALAPLVIHLLSRSRPPVFHFPSVAFLRKVQRQTVRPKRPHDRLLLLLRTLLALALIGLVARPYLHLSTAGRSDRDHAVCIVVDATASMGASEDGRTRFSAAGAEAAELLNGLTARDRANLIWMEAAPRPAFPSPGLNMGRLKQEARQARVSYQTANPADALSLAVEMLKEEADRARTLYVVSDFQASQWEDLQTFSADGIQVVAVPVAHRNLPNTALVDLQCEPASPLAGEPFTVTATLANYGPESIRRKVYLSTGNQRQSQMAELPPGGRVPVLFRVTENQAGPIFIDISMDEDAFPVDDQRSLVVDAVQHLNVGLCGVDENLHSTWLRVLTALEWTQPLHVDQLDQLEQPDLVLLAGWDGHGAETLDRLLADGVPVICYPAQGVPAPDMDSLFSLDSTATPWQLEQLKEPVYPLIADTEAPLFSLQTQGAQGDFSSAIFHRRYRFSTPIAPHQILLAWPDGIPALIRMKERPLYLWNLPLAPHESNWAAREEFFLLFAELLRLNRADGSLSPSTYPGQSLRLDLPARRSPENLRLVDSERIPLAFELMSPDPESLRAISMPAPHPGVYRWMQGERILKTTSVAFPEIESDLSVGAPPMARDASGSVVSDGNHARRLREGIELWPWFLAAVVGLTLVELLTAWRAGRS